MPSGRLLRETNPVPGEKPGFIPQHGDGNGNYIETNPNNPLPTSDTTLQTKMDALNQKIDSIIDGTTPASTQLTGSYAKKVTLINAVAITDTNAKFYDLITSAGLTENEIRQYNRFRITLINSHNQPAEIRLISPLAALSTTAYSASGEIYSEATPLGANNGRLVLSSKAGGTGANTNYKSIPALEGLHSNIMLYVKFATAPSSGSITAVVEMGV